MTGIAHHRIDRAHGTRARYVAEKCRCAPCRAANARYVRDRRTSGAPWNGYVSADAARAHLLALSEVGVGFVSVHLASDVSRTVLQKVLAGKGRIRAETERRILAVDEGARADGAIAPTEDARRMRGILKKLRRRGFRRCDIVQLVGPRGWTPTASPLVRTVAVVDRLWRRVQRGEVKPRPRQFVAPGPTVALVGKLLAEGWITEEELTRRLGFRVDRIGGRHPTMLRVRAERVAELAAELERAQQAAAEAVERARDFERFAGARNAA